MAKQEEKFTYRAAGVDIEEAERFLSGVAPLIRKTWSDGVLGDIGGFASFFELSKKGWKNPILLAATDGVGTKLKVAFASRVYTTVGVDLVAMCVNDIITHGGKPLFFLDYFATGKLSRAQARDVIKGIVRGCREANCSLVGGETAEMPSFYPEGEFDLAGFCVGIAEKRRLVTGERIKKGDVIIGLPSSGFHSNGYSLLRKLIFDRLGLGPDDPFPGSRRTVRQVLLKPTKIYVRTVLDLLSRYPVTGMAHITGGGFYENIGRILPEGLGARIDSRRWNIPR
ncbi:MAG: phosphoribosylformylglycinamidine cyclo-ligase, partial [Deltaproteobacteria bacterium]